MSDDEGGFDFAASLGGSLMKDLLADLAVDEEDAQEWLNLEQLEQELQHLDLDQGSAVAPPSTAAGMVVSSQAAAAQAFQTHSLMGSAGAMPPPLPTSTTQQPEVSAMDAWSLSLQKFTASSVMAADFLEADSARKQQQSSATTTTASGGVAPPPGLKVDLLAKAEEYDVTLSANVPPPPGITPTASQQVISQAAAKLVQDLQQTQVETTVRGAPPAKQQQKKPPPPQKPTSASRAAAPAPADSLLVEQLQKGLSAVHETEVLEEEQEMAYAAGTKTPPTGQFNKLPKPTPLTPQNSIGFIPESRTPQSYPGAPTPQPTPVATKPVNQAIMAASVPPIPMMPPVMAVPLRTPGPAWQSPPPPPPPAAAPRRVVFANPHPAAPPIHAAQLQGRYMKARDITYVVHGMLRPILAAEQSGAMSTYHLQFWTRHHPVKPPPSSSSNKSGSQLTRQQQQQVDYVAQEVASRAKKAQEWSESNKTLGRTAKTNVARPRALIAVTNQALNAGADDASPDSSASKKHQRAALWKSRIYCDQAYQALQAVIDAWKSQGSASAQPHLIKLFKCLGVAVVTVQKDDDQGHTVVQNQYTVDPEALRLLLKLPKGQVLLARVLEQALLPPAVVQALLPVALDVLCGSGGGAVSSPENTNASQADGRADDRVFAAWSVVVQTLPELSGPTIQAAVRAIQRHSGTALSSTVRMQCTHALLQRGGATAARDAEFAKEWTVTEQEFMNILAGL